MLFNLFTSFVWGGVLQKKGQQSRILICKMFRDFQVRTVLDSGVVFFQYLKHIQVSVTLCNTLLYLI